MVDLDMATIVKPSPRGEAATRRWLASFSFLKTKGSGLRKKKGRKG
jgi:hypothetical protein